MGFVCVTLLGLMATGLDNVHQATTTTVRAQIIQTIVNASEVQAYSTSYSTNINFDDEGMVTTSGTYLYTAAVTNGPATAAGASSAYDKANATLLVVKISSKAAPSVTNTFNLVWPNMSGN